MVDSDTQLNIPARPIERFQLSLSAARASRTCATASCSALPGAAALLGLIVYWTRRTLSSRLPHAHQSHARPALPERRPVLRHLPLRAQLAHGERRPRGAPPRARGRGGRHPRARGRERGRRAARSASSGGATGWFLTRPIEWRANPNAVSRIISDLQFLEHETSFAVRDVVKNGQSLADYGLDHPKLTVSFTSGGPDTTGAAPVTTHAADRRRDEGRPAALPALRRRRRGSTSSAASWPTACRLRWSSCAPTPC